MLAWVSAYLKYEFIFYQHSTYWENFNLEEIQKNREFISSQPFESRIQSHTPIPIYEAQQPPLSYLVQVPIYLIFYDQDILTRVFALRIFSVLVTAAAIVIAYKTISLLFDDRLIRLGSLMFIVFNPMFTTNIARVNNEFMTIFLFSAFLYLVVRYLKEKTNLKYCLFIGVVLGLGLLTKSTFLPALLLVPLFIFLKHIQKNTKESQIRAIHSFKNLGIIFAVTGSLASWLYLERFTTGNFSGLHNLPGISFAKYIQGIFEIPLNQFIYILFHTFWGVYGSSTLWTPYPYFHIVIIMVCISIIGLGFGITIKLKKQGSDIFRDWRYQSIFVVGLSFVFLILAQLVFNIQYYYIAKELISAGWYSFISFTAIAMVLLLGYRTIIINSKLKRFKEESLFGVFIVLIILNITTFYWLVPKYYLGV